ncbi:NADP-dependent phosphogluconate dehydrogenase [Aegicerativicinus sediminis]
MNKGNDLGIIGLGTMGSQLALNAAENGIQVSVYNRDIGLEKGTVDNFIKSLPNNFEINGFTEYHAFIASLNHPKTILLMVPAGTIVDTVIEELLPFLDNGDILIDGGNSFYKDSNRRYRNLKEKGLHFIGCGISGGSEGARHGCSMMPGGSRIGYNITKNIFSKLSSKDKNDHPCMNFIGNEGAGHFVKMIHNGIEYGEMQLIAETYSYLALYMGKEEIASLFKSWCKQGYSSYLLEITIEILTKKDEKGYVLDRISDKASGKGTGQWSVNAGLELGSVVSVMAAALSSRLLSSDSGLRQSKIKILPKADIHQIAGTKILDAFYFARLINHLQGFHLIQQASTDYGWNLNLKEISRIWTNGCIIRSELMEQLAFTETFWNGLLDLEWVKDTLESNLNSVRTLIRRSAELLHPMDAYSSAFNFWLALNKQQLPTNLIQAQRDYFGNHGFKLSDGSDDNLHHYAWN